MPTCNITCPSCNFSKNIPVEKISNEPMTIRCPSCDHRFLFQRPQLSSAMTASSKSPDHENSSAAQAAGGSGLKRVGAGKIAMFLILVAIMGLVGARFWLDSKVRAVPFPYWLSTSEHGVAVLYGDKFYVVDHDGGIQLSKELPAGTEPCQILWHKEAIWVSDFKNHCIHRYTNGWEDAIQLQGPEIGVHLNVAVEPSSGELYVTDSQNSRVLVYGPEGEFIREFGKRGRSDGNLNFPKDLFFDASGHLIIGNTRRPAVDAFQTDGTFVDKLVKPLGSPLLYFLTDVAVGDQNIVTIECDELVINCLLNQYDKDGRLLRKIMQPPGKTAAGDVAAWGGKVYVSDCRNRRVNVFSMDHLEKIGPLSAALDDIGVRYNETAVFYGRLSKGSLYSMLLCLIPMLWIYFHSKKS